MSIPRKHHYLPKFYLKGFSFTIPKGKNHIWQYDKKNEKIVSVSIEDAGCKRDYNKFERKKGEYDFESFEKYFSILEYKFSNVINKIKKHELLNNEDKEYFADFVSTQIFRVPNFRENTNTFYKQLYQKGSQISVSNPHIFEKIKQNIEKSTNENFDISYKKMKEMIYDPNYEIIVPDEMSLRIFKRSKYEYREINNVVDDIATVILKMNWNFLFTNDIQKFVTSDNPVYWINPKQSSRWNGGGLIDPNIQLSFPISKDIIFFAHYNNSPHLSELYYKVEPSFFKEMNERTKIFATRFIFTSEKLEICKLITNK